jgi:predicted nucleic acid-binding protein
VIFIDTGAFIARYVERDQHHSEATSFWNELAASGVQCVTSNFVICETLTLLARRTTYDFAARKGLDLYSSKVLRILRSNASDEIDALSWFHKFADQGVSFTDCTSISIMKREQIQEVFAFDRHFSLAGIRLRPQRAVF